MNNIDAYPLSWPAMWPRSKARQRSRFDPRLTLADAQASLFNELRLLGATQIIVSSNLRLRRDGQPYVDQREFESDPGIAVYFTLDRKPVVIPCDRWDRPQDNLHAVELTIAALRGIDRWGAHEMVAAAFQGFQALPAGTAAASWWSVLDVHPNASEVEIEQAYRRMAKSLHPDAGGSAEAFQTLQDAYRQAKSARKTA